jgi:hypothetical protein
MLVSVGRLLDAQTAQRLLLLTLLASLLLRMVLVRNGGQYYWPDEVGYEEAPHIRAGFQKALCDEPPALLVGTDAARRQGGVMSCAFGGTMTTGERLDQIPACACRIRSHWPSPRHRAPDGAQRRTIRLGRLTFPRGVAPICVLAAAHPESALTYNPAHARGGLIVPRPIPACLAVWLVAAAAVTAADFWETKPFLEWSDKEVEKVMGDSPWAALVSVPLPPSAPQPSGDIGGGAGGGGRGGGGGDSFGPGPRRVRVTISWRSALPVKQALVRGQSGQRSTVSPEAQKMLDQDEPFYVVALHGLPPQYTRGKTIESFLRRSGKPPIPAQQAGTQQTRGGGAILLIGFPKTDAVTLDDGDVELDVKLEGIRIKKKFKLKEMVFAGRLEL